MPEHAPLADFSASVLALGELAPFSPYFKSTTLPVALNSPAAMRQK